ncbi:VPLPA-CTERM sorting domain-containing protein [uncultured Jannaschia sp.]|uniref:VPLPA-CTERM sorting domain-containing protein n=1 Tax=uncultured Jannaschia sp. TaxID=293347 RepID=UPI0026059F7C|nr:VPLPA-CTERM sorting domain-containing protein [uncultured Jannaschia sp.]
MFRKITGLVLGSFMMIGTASAATVSYTTAETDPKVQLLLDDGAVDGAVRFTLSAVTGFADFLGLGFDFSGTKILKSKIDLVSFASTHNRPDVPALVLFGDNTGSQSTCGNGCNFNGGGGTGDTAFDYILRIGEQGGGKKNVAGIVFDIGGVALADFSNFAVRAQETSNGNSIKYGLNPDATVPSPVPLPAAGFGLMAGLGALAALRRRKRAAI